LVKLKGFQKLTPIEEAMKLLLSSLKLEPLKTVNVPLIEALNRVLAEDIIAEEDLPNFDRSAVDGYAVRASDTFGASQFSPKVLKLAEADRLMEGEAREVWTGSPLPEGADAVVMLEHVKRLNGEIEVWVAVAPGENVSKKGEDVAKGEVAVGAGTRLRPHHLGLIAALGRDNVPVFEKPKVAILATGNELVEPGQELKKGQIFEVNRLIISSLCKELGAEPVDLGIAKDDVDEILEKIRFGLEAADIIVTTGGTSVGASDLVPIAINRLGKPGVIVHGIAMRPAMPTALAILNNKPIIMLSGNPVAAIFGFEVFVRPLILKMLKVKHELRPTIKAKLTRRICTSLGRKNFVRVRVYRSDNEFYAEPVSVMGSGIISTMTRANGYIIVPENCEGLEAGETVIVYTFDDVEG
jgi:molybdopterin molybdotransferase